MVPGAVGDGVTDDTVALQAALDDLDRLGGGVLDLGGGIHRVRRLSLRPQVGVARGTLVQAPGTLDWTLSLDGHPTRPQRDWLVDRVVVQADGAAAPGAPGVVLVHATGVQFDRPLLRDVRILGGRGDLVRFSSADPQRVFTIQPRLEHLTLDGLDARPGTTGLVLGPGVFDSSLVSVDVGRCDVGVRVTGTVKHRFTDVRGWGCGSAGLHVADCAHLTLVNCEFDNNVGHGAVFLRSSSVHCVACAFTNSGYTDDRDEFGIGVGRLLPRPVDRDGSVLAGGGEVHFTACRFGNEDEAGAGRGEQRFGLRVDDATTAVVAGDCTFRDNRTAAWTGAQVTGARGARAGSFAGGARLDPQTDTRFDVGFYSDAGAGLELYRADDPQQAGRLVLVTGGAPGTGGLGVVASDGSGGFAELAALLPRGGLVLAPVTQPPDPPATGGVLFVRDGALMYRGPAGTVTRLAPP